MKTFKVLLSVSILTLSGTPAFAGIITSLRPHLTIGYYPTIPVIADILSGETCSLSINSTSCSLTSSTSTQLFFSCTSPAANSVATATLTCSIASDSVSNIYID